MRQPGMFGDWAEAATTLFDWFCWAVILVAVLYFGAHALLAVVRFLV